MKKSAFLSDVAFAFFFAALPSLCFFRFLRYSLPVSLVLATLCGVGTACAVAALLQRKRKRALQTTRDERAKENLLHHLASLSPERANAFFRNAFSTAESTARRIAVDKFSLGEELYLLRVRYAPVSADEVAAFARYKSNRRKIILCRALDEEAEKISRRANIAVRTWSDVYLAVKARNALPQENLIPLADKRARKLHFKKTGARPFLTSGALVLGTSLVTPFPFYYLLFGGALCLAALLVRIFGER